MVCSPNNLGKETVEEQWLCCLKKVMFPKEGNVFYATLHNTFPNKSVGEQWLLRLEKVSGATLYDLPRGSCPPLFFFLLVTFFPCSLGSIFFL